MRRPDAVTRMSTGHEHREIIVARTLHSLSITADIWYQTDR